MMIVAKESISPDTLLFAASFFGYAQEIKSELERRGRRVMWFEDRPGIDTFTKALIRICPSMLANKTASYFNTIIESVRNYDIKDVLIIKGESMSASLISKMRRLFPQARFTLYFWDSYKNMPADSASKVDIFDQVFSFDPADTEKDSRLRYRPLFFLPQYENLPICNPDIDILFIGTIHTDRYKILKKLDRSLCGDISFKKVLYFSSVFLYYARKISDPLFKDANRSQFIFKPIGTDEILNLVSRSRIVVDIERPIQTGLTMRSIEMLGASKKLITTNGRTAQSDFYRPENILVVDRENPTIPTAFLESDYSMVPRDIIKRYSLGGWIDEVLPESS